MLLLLVAMETKILKGKNISIIISSEIIFDWDFLGLFTI